MFTGDDEALVEIKTGEIYEGYISNKKLRIVQEWLEENNTGKQQKKTSTISID